MKRRDIPQLLNQSWFPQILRTCVYEFMTWFVNRIGAAKPFLPVIEEGLQHSDTSTIINLKQPLGAGMETVEPLLGPEISVEHVPVSEIVEGTPNRKGLYMSVNSFHQLNPDQAIPLLQHVANSRNPVAILEGNNDSLWQVVGMLVFVPLTVIITAPLVKPFRISRLIFTYLIPVLPFITLLDGFLALFKLYAPVDLDELTQSVQVEGYAWKSGKLDNGRGGKIMYLLGYPEEG